MTGFYLLLALLSACHQKAVEPVWFEEQALQRGLNFHHQSGSSGKFWTPEIMTGGAALADLDGDGDLDAYLVQGGNLPGGDDNTPGNQLFLNQGNGRFVVDVDSGAADTGYGMGVTAGDYDNDGDVDLYVTNWGPNVLLRNRGDGRFEDVTAAAGVGDPGWGTAAAFLDLDRDDDLDLFLVNYLNWAPGSAHDCGGTYCGPSGENATVDRLYRNDGDGTFTDVSTNAGLNTSFGNGLGIVGADVNNDGQTDVFVANDGVVNQLWLNQGNLQFIDDAFLWGCAMDDHGIAKAGMGVAVADVDDDSDLDILVMNLGKQTDSFYLNEGTHFVDGTSQVGLGGSSRRFTRFGVVLADFNNDGALDIYEANGRIDHSPEDTRDDPFAEPNVLYRGTSAGRFELFEPEGGAATELIHTSRAVAMGDVDNDGGIDLLVVNRDGPAYLLMNQIGGEGNSVSFRVLTHLGRDAHGAKVSVTIDSARRLHREVQTAGSYLASHDPRVHFGLGDAQSVRDVQVQWPTGELESFGDFDSGSTIELRFGEGQFAGS